MWYYWKLFEKIDNKTTGHGDRSECKTRPAYGDGLACYM